MKIGSDVLCTMQIDCTSTHSESVCVVCVHAHVCVSVCVCLLCIGLLAHTLLCAECISSLHS